MPIKYVFVDGVNFSMRVGKSVETVPVLVAIGVTETGRRMVLGLQAGDKESASSWREFFKDLKKRRLDCQRGTVRIMDGLPGLEKVFKEEFPKAKVQRCQVHAARKVLAKVPKKFKEAIADEMRSIFYSSSKQKALELFATFKSKGEGQLPFAVKCLENSIEACLTFFKFPEEEWISLRTTNINDIGAVLLSTKPPRKSVFNYSNAFAGKDPLGASSLVDLGHVIFLKSTILL